MPPRILEVRTKILKKNDELARALRARFAEHGVYVVNVVSGPGAGKTELLTKLMRELAEDLRVAAVVGDLATENDATRLAESGCRAEQILTGTMCHLEADMVERAIAGFDLDELDVLFIENVGNLVCPQGFDLGEDLRMLLFASTEGEDKPLKYPTLINTCDVVVLSKMDLADAAGFDVALARSNCDEARPAVSIFETSGRLNAGIAELADDVRTRISIKRSA
jgi:hydrogenase nickel incorporation protein HypB